LSIAAALGLGQWAKSIAMARPAGAPDAHEPLSNTDAEFASWNGRQDRLFVVGDSHAHRLLHGIADWARSTKPDINIVPMISFACPPIEGVTPYIGGYSQPECVRANKANLDQLRAALPSPGAKRQGYAVGVVVSARWTVYLDQANIS